MVIEGKLPVSKVHDCASPGMVLSAMMGDRKMLATSAVAMSFRSHALPEAAGRVALAALAGVMPPELATLEQPLELLSATPSAIHRIIRDAMVLPVNAAD
jgi:hypothetical protein